MYTKQEAAQLRKEFWTAFGQYMKPVPTEGGEKVNWINYKSGDKHIRFTMQADQYKAIIAIEIMHPDTDIQQLYTEQFLQMKKLFHTVMKEEWAWDFFTTDAYGNTISRIYKERIDISIFDKNNWPQLITFFKYRIIRLHEFWCSARYTFETLGQ